MRYLHYVNSNHQLKCERYSLWYQIFCFMIMILFFWGCFSFMCRVLHINDIIPTCVFSFRPQMTFFLILDFVSKYLREMWEVMQECWRSCNAYEDAQEEKCGFSIFVEVSEKSSSKEDSYWIKAHKIEAQTSQIQVIHALQYFFTRCSFE